MTSARSRLASILALCVVVLGARTASATDALEFPDNGTEQLGRGGAWVARASNPLATFYNPAGLAGQATGVLANVNLVMTKICFQRAGDGERLDLAPTPVAYPEVCNENTGLQPLPALAAAYRVNERLGLGLSVAPPSLYGELQFPETVPTRNSFGAQAELPAGQRYMLIEQTGIALNITLGAGMEVADGIRVGAGFVWGLAKYKLANANMSVNPTPQGDGTYLDPVAADLRAELEVADWFMPGVVVGALWSPVSELDVGVSVFAQHGFDAHGDLELKANYWTNNGISDNPDVANSSEIEKGLAHFRVANPLEVRVGARFHMPRSRQKKLDAVRDPLADDVFDVELDVSYTRNSAYERAELRFPDSPVVPIPGSTPGRVPVNNDVDIKARDTVGFRLGGDYVIVPAKLGVRAGGWFEPSAQDEAYASVAFNAPQRIGVAVGAVYRLAFVDIEAAYMHVFFKTVDNGGNGKVLVVSGDESATPPNRSPYAINGGRIEQSANIFSLGATAHF